MRTPEEFDEIRPYDPEELPAVFDELTADPEFQAVLAKIMPNVSLEELRANLKRCKSNRDMQKTYIYPLLRNLIETQSKGIVFDVDKTVDKGLPHTFITNHRDIVLDSALLSISLVDNGFGDTPEIGIGDNLLIRPWITKLVRINKSFIVQRSAGLRQMLTSSARLSRYMHYVIAVKGESIWIAQREGRAKDSDDRTQDAILKMMAMGGDGSIVERLKQLNLLPTAISYEYDPCDFLKAKEFQQKRDIEGFKKSKADDLTNMQTGIFGYKGRIFFRTAEPLNAWIDTLNANMPKAELVSAIAAHIDQGIHRSYELFPSNYAAADLLRNASEFAAYYTPEEKKHFEEYVEGQLKKVDLERPDMDFLRERILVMYANPVFNHIAACHE